MTAVSDTLTPTPTTTPSAHFDPADFGLGTLVPVVGGHHGAGASGLALALADAAADAGLRTLLIDGADPARSGLANVWTSQLRSDQPCRAGAVVGTVQRTGVTGRVLRTSGRPVPSWSYPALTEWVTAEFRDHHAPFDVTVVDVGWDAWTGFDEVRFGPMAWVSATAARSMPVLVSATTTPSLRLTAGVHARWWSALASAGVAAAPQLALTNAAVIPASLLPSCPPSLLDLVSVATCFPNVPAAALGGWTEDQSTRPSLASATRLLAKAPDALSQRLPTVRHVPQRFRRTPKEN